jgi:hypothetical protein
LNKKHFFLDAWKCVCSPFKVNGRFARDAEKWLEIQEVSGEKSPGGTPPGVD